VLLSGAVVSCAVLVGCSGQRIREIGRLSKDPILRINVGTTIELRFPSVKFEDEAGSKSKEAAPQ